MATRLIGLDHTNPSEAGFRTQPTRRIDIPEPVWTLPKPEPCPEEQPDTVEAPAEEPIPA